jgi:flavin reductase (DIM6/NTAB) family NADH-FMN oxidoreductase RutF
MKNFQSIPPKEINENAIKLIGEKWTLITAGDPSSFNMMTASWGNIGFLWNKPVVTVFVRPQRYTFQFTEKKDEFTLSFFQEEYRSVLQFCGNKSGAEVNKVEKTGLTPVFTPNGNIAFKESYLVLECRKLYTDFLKSEAFLDRTLIEKNYKANDFHKFYVAEITKAWIKKSTNK